MSQTSRRQLLRENLRETGLGLMETLWVWFGNSSRLVERVEVEGFEHLQSVDGRGVMVLGFHFNNIELGALLLASRFPVIGVYRRHDNALMEYLQTRGRLNNARPDANGLSASLLDRSEVREIVRNLKSGRLVWIAADQDLGKRRSLFAPFFGIQTATSVAPSRLARLSGCRVVPVTFERLPEGRYLLRIEPALEDFPGDSEQADCEHYNRLVEEMVRRRPEAYMWVHKRFKTRPPGEISFYQ